MITDKTINYKRIEKQTETKTNKKITKRLFVWNLKFVYNIIFKVKKKVYSNNVCREVSFIYHREHTYYYPIGNLI